MIYVAFRIIPAPGQGPALLQEVAKFNKLLQKHGAKPVANFIVGIGQGQGEHAHLFAYEDWGALGAAGQALQADPEWQQFIVGVGTKVASVNSTVFQPTPESGLQ